MKEAISKNRPARLVGEEALIISIIHQAVRDAVCGHEIEHKSAARAYFAGEVYEQHLSWLGLPSEWLPELLENGRVGLLEIETPLNER